MIPDFVNDLKTLREQKGLGLEDLHEKTRIPVDVLKRFESGNLLSDPTYSDVYIRAFLKSYAGALDKSPRRILVAYDAHKTGNYVGGLVDESDEERRSKPSPTKPQEKAEDQEEAEGSPAPTAPSKKEDGEQQETPEDSSSPVEALSRREEEPERDGHEAPMVRTAQNFPRRTAQRRTPDRSVDTTSWLPVLGLLAVLIIALGGLIWYLFFYEPVERDGSLQVADQEVTPEPGTEPEARDDTASPDLALPIRVTVTAGGDGLQNFRVTEVPNERLGHWVEAGESVTFESDSLVVFWGQGATGLTGEATLELQGFRWAPTDRSVLRIDRQRGQQLLDSLHAANLR